MVVGDYLGGRRAYASLRILRLDVNVVLAIVLCFGVVLSVILLDRLPDSVLVRVGVFAVLLGKSHTDRSGRPTEPSSPGF